jgi:hypothetical protein
MLKKFFKRSTSGKRPIKKLTTDDYEHLGRMMETIYDTNYASKHRLVFISFLKGVAAGFGGVIGATIVVAVLVWTLSLFHNVPFINKITNNIQNTVRR